ncbi:MAG TPA: PilZ domain-containing protein [Terracidiphilus sp.]|nr:PilZ domain-containing protein [Terracidiphilus sp.]
MYNQTRESFLSLGVTVAGASDGHLRGMIEKLTSKADSGLWMKPYRGIAQAERLSPIDLVYLDTDLRVIQEIESFPTSSAQSLRNEAASALALPTHTIYSSQTQPGDQLVICVAAEMEKRLERLSNLTPAAITQSGISSVDIESAHGPAGHRSSKIQTASEQSHIQVQDSMSDFESKTGKPNSLKTWLQNWLSSDRRRALRTPLPGLVAYYWTGSAPRAYQIADISASGFYLLTEERWFPGTIVLMTLQRTDSSGQNLDDSIAVQSRVVRWGSDGLGLAFVLARPADVRDGDSIREHGADKKTLERFLARMRTETSR